MKSKTSTTAKNVKATDGDVILNLGDEKVTLVPTPNATRLISNHFGGLRDAAARVGAFDMQAITTVVTIGAKLKDDAAKGIGDKLFYAGANRMAPKVIEYIVILMNGGKRVDEDADTSVDEENPGEGNGED